MKNNQPGHVYDYKETILKESGSKYQRSGEIYSISEKGIHMNRIQEMGLFNFGSTIVLIFTSQEPVKFKYEVGDEVKIGNQLYFKN
jgi:hypothetical protein